MAPQLIFGTATFGMNMPAFQDAETVTLLLQVLKALGVTRLDTAARYPDRQHWVCGTAYGRR